MEIDEEINNILDAVKKGELLVGTILISEDDAGMRFYAPSSGLVVGSISLKELQVRLGNKEISIPTTEKAR